MAISVHCAHDKIVPLSKLKPHPGNPNKHPPEQIALLAKVIAAQGWRNPIVVSNRSGLITKGHARREAALSLKCATVPVDYQDYATESEELADMIADNRIAELAEADRSMLRELAEQLDDGAFDMDLTGFDHDALEELMTAAPPDSDIDAEPQIDKAEELRVKWGVERGQIWELGEHRIMCGDAASANGFVEGDTMVTDPPYGIGYKYRNHNDQSNSANLDLVKRVMQGFKGPRIWTCGLMNLARDLAWNPTAKVLCWHKGFAAAGNGIGGASTWEPVLSVEVKGGTLPDDYLHFGTDRVEGLRDKHPCPKPTGLFAHLIRYLGGKTIWEPFLGSGTTLIACEQLGRKCRAMEIDPGYVAVSIQRWADATGKTPRLLNGK